MQQATIIRERGQLTIPSVIRKRIPWASPNSVVSVSLAQVDEIIVRPYTVDGEKGLNWDKLWKQIKKVRAYKGKAGNLSKFIAKDRLSH